MKVGRTDPPATGRLCALARRAATVARANCASGCRPRARLFAAAYGIARASGRPTAPNQQGDPMRSSRLTSLLLAAAIARRWPLPASYTPIDPTPPMYFEVGIWVIPSSAATLSRWPAKFGWMAPPSKARWTSVSAASVTTGFAQRDEQLRGVEFFNVARFPTVTFAHRNEICWRTADFGQGRADTAGVKAGRAENQPVLLRPAPDEQNPEMRR